MPELSAPLSHTHEARARVTETEDLMHGAPNSLPREPPLSHLMEFASLIDFYDFERTDAEPREGAVSTSGIYRQDKGPSLKGVFTGAMVNHRLRASGLRPRPWHHIKVLIATCGAGVRLQEKHGKLQAKSNQLGARAVYKSNKKRQIRSDSLQRIVLYNPKVYKYAHKEKPGNKGRAEID